ncbi:hypothetical protein ACG9XR_02995 [Acinetobacter guillouiae]|uniref:DUF3137 domain-containing protein n=1 Tax=Acinetobacter guillouiae NIPH 991 TaxID=1217656 RepID=N8YG53_ACIGI|nr:hypothetical protein [Acinetobacter guillouiae]ENV18255.1 hypothetical protein F964_01579 [Acinetobacter guillouiae NIPH 991]
MPIETVERLLHLRTRKNKHVMRNIARLWEIGQQAQSAQDILDGLHPWGECRELFFHNLIPRLLFMIGVLTAIFGWLIHHYIPYPLSLLAALLCCFGAYLIYEQSDPIDEVINFLEQRMMFLRYELDFNKTPSHISTTSNSFLVMSKLKQSFPLFSQGNVLNEIEQFASTKWFDGEQEHHVMLFQYHYVDEFSLPNTQGEKQIIKETHKNQWGAFIFQLPALGFAASNKHHEFIPPYTQIWKTADILVSQNLYIFGYDQHQLARTISPSITLKLSDFFQHYSGDIVYHFEENMLCYMGDQDLFRIRRKKQKLQDISALRGHLRTLTMPEYEKFKQCMLNLIS